jgi:hypothetical protein
MKRPSLGQGPETSEEVIAIYVIAKYGLSHNSTSHHMMQDALRFQTGTTGHEKPFTKKP